MAPISEDSSLIPLGDQKHVQRNMKRFERLQRRLGDGKFAWNLSRLHALGHSQHVGTRSISEFVKIEILLQIRFPVAKPSLVTKTYREADGGPLNHFQVVFLDPHRKP